MSAPTIITTQFDTITLEPVCAVSMEALNLDQKQVGTKQLRASQFPEPADVYVCDKCGRDITVHLYSGRAHVQILLRPSRYVCRCGQK